MRRFFTDPSNVGDKYIIIDDKEDIKHIVKVLRLGLGDVINISDGEIWEYEAEINGISDDEVSFLIMDKQHFATEPSVEITLYQGVPKAGKMELIIQKSVELGITAVVPLMMDRTVVNDNGKFKKKIERWQKISAEAVKQCKRGIIPKVYEQMDFNDMCKQINKYDLVIFPYENAKGYTIKDLLKSSKPKKIAVIIGPEGGFSDREAKKLTDMGIQGVSLGKSILRTETAGIVAVSMILYEYEL